MILVQLAYYIQFESEFAIIVLMSRHFVITFVHALFEKCKGCDMNGCMQMVYNHVCLEGNVLGFTTFKHMKHK